MPRVFIGIPTLNRPQYVRETLRSVLAQTFPDFRVIVSDNVSEPGVAESVAGFIRDLNDPRVSFFQQPQNVGEYGQGWFFFRSVKDEEFFVILHDDDTLEPDYLATALHTLDAHPDAALFVANPIMMDAKGVDSPEKTNWQRRYYGRAGTPEGLIDIRTTHMACGFTPICATVFRTQALRESGFVDPDCHGNFPFEMNIFLRLADIGAQGWFCPRELLRFRFHTEALSNYLHLMDNPHVVSTMIKLLARRRYTGMPERRRRIILGRLYRASAAILARQNDPAGCRRDALNALRTCPLSPRTLASAPLAVLAPGLYRRTLPPLPVARVAPLLNPESSSAPPPARNAAP